MTCDKNETGEHGSARVCVSFVARVSRNRGRYRCERDPDEEASVFPRKGMLVK